MRTDFNVYEVRKEIRKGLEGMPERELRVMWEIGSDELVTFFPEEYDAKKTLLLLLEISLELPIPTQKCSVEECTREAMYVEAGLCKSHYMRTLRNTPLDSPLRKYTRQGVKT